MAWFSSIMLHGAFLIALVVVGAMSFTKQLDLPDSGNAVPIEVVSSAEITDQTNISAIAPIEEDIEVEAPPTDDGAPQTIARPPEPVSEAIPLPAPKAPPPKKEERRPTVDLEKLGGLIDRSRKEEGRERTAAPQDAPKGANPRAGVGAAGADLSLSEQDAIRAHVEQYWRAPADLPNPERLVVRVRFEINPDGSLAGQPEVLSPRGALDPSQRTAVENALRAIRVASPLPVAKTRRERTVFTMNFDPRVMAGMR